MDYHLPNSFTLESYRCFRGKQSARLAPLTLLVGNNSTGKTSFLAIIRVLWDVLHQISTPDFRKEPYHLGAYRDIANNRTGRGGYATAFSAGYGDTEGNSLSVTFEERISNPYPVELTIAREDVCFRAQELKNGKHLISLTAPNGGIEKTVDHEESSWGKNEWVPLGAIVSRWTSDLQMDNSLLKDNEETSEPLSHEDAFNKLLRATGGIFTYFAPLQPPFASAPIRSQPRRTYDPSRPMRDPEGEYVPTYLANLAQRDKKEWARLKEDLEEFGCDSGLFDEIDIKLLGKTGGSPFQVQIRKFGQRLKGAKRNLIDVGYGVSQALPLLTELLRKNGPRMFLLQQPEVHLHPSAQAALGSLFCSLAGPDRQLIVETHSDYILDRVRMDVRDKKTDLKPEDVSILFFEAGELDVKIHSLRLDENGNVLDTPPGYGQFFMDETRRSIGL